MFGPAVFRTSDLHAHMCSLKSGLWEAMNYYGKSCAKSSCIKHERLYHIISFKVFKGWSATDILTNMEQYNTSVMSKVWSLLRNELGLTNILIDAIVNGTLSSRDTTHDGTPLKIFHQKRFEDEIMNNIVWIDDKLKNRTMEELDAMEEIERLLLMKPGAPKRLNLEYFNAHFGETILPDLKMLLLNNERKLSCMSPKERQKIIDSKLMTDDEALLTFISTKDSSKKRKRVEKGNDTSGEEPATKKTCI